MKRKRILFFLIGLMLFCSLIALSSYVLGTKLDGIAKIA